MTRWPEIFNIPLLWALISYLKVEFIIVNQSSLSRNGSVCVEIPQIPKSVVGRLIRGMFAEKSQLIAAMLSLW